MAYLGKTKEPLMFFNATLDTIVFARNLRHSMTTSEKILWRYLKRKQFSGYKFRRQQPIGVYVADFYCHELRLVIEVDGPIHKRREQHDHDVNRTAVLENYGIEVIRFTNQDVTEGIEWVIESILKTIHERAHKPSPPRGGQGGVRRETNAAR